MKKNLFLLTAACCGFASLSLALAQPEQPPEKEKKGGFFGGPKNEVRKVVKDFDKDGDGRLNTEERKAAREFLAKQGGGKGKGPGGFGPGGGGFNPGMMFAKPIFEAIDTQKTGKVTAKQAEAAVVAFFASADKEKKNALTEAQLAEAITAAMPPPNFGPKEGGKEAGGKEGGGKKKGGGFGGFFGGPGPMLAPAILKKAGVEKDGKITLKQMQDAAAAQFKESDKNNDGNLDEAEVGDAVSKVMALNPPKFGPGGPGGGFGKERNEPGKPGPKVSPSEVKNFPKAGFYDADVLRTIFIEFENKEWESELAAFYKTDVEVPATITVDGKKYENVGVHFRGMSSYFGVPAGSKHSLNLAMDFVESKQRLYGYKTINLLNAHDDPTLLHTILYSHIGRQHLPTPKANMVKVVINGESWGLYTNVQQFNKEFTKENFQSAKGARWKVQGSPGGQGGFNYLGDDLASYKRIYSIKSDDNEKDWKALVELCKTIDKTPLDKLEDALKPMLDIDGALWFLALDVALINGDGYWTRASDYTIYRDPKGMFHLVPHDMNEAFGPAMGPGMGFGGKGGGGGGGGSPVALDPLVGAQDTRKPLRSRLLAVPALKKKYLTFVAQIAERDLDWKNLGPVVKQYRDMIDREVELDTRKLSSLDAFRRTTADEAPREGGGRGMSLRQFADARREYLLNHPAVKEAQK